MLRKSYANSPAQTLDTVSASAYAPGMDTHNDTPTTYVAWSPERGWHSVNTAEHAALQAGIVASITRRAPSGWVARAQAGTLVSKDMSGAVRS